MSKSGSKALPKQKASNTPLDQGSVVPPYVWPLVGAGLLFVFFYLFHPILMPFGVAIVVAYILDPAVGFLVKRGFSRTSATSVMVFSVLGTLITAFFFAIPFVKNELQNFSTSFPQYLSVLSIHGIPKAKAFLEWIADMMPATMAADLNNNWLLNWDEKIQSTLSQNLTKMASWLMTALAGLFANSLALVNLVSLIFLTPLLIFYLLRDWPQMLAFFRKLIPAHQQKSTQKLGSDVNKTLSSYFRGQSLVCVVMTVYYCVALSSMGLNYALTIGMVSGFLTFIPYVGFLTGSIAAIAVALAQFGDLPSFLIIVAIYGAGHIVEGFYLVPRLVGDSVGLHPVWVIFALLGGGVLMGFTGLILAVPVAAILAVLLRFMLKRYQAYMKAVKK